MDGSDSPCPPMSTPDPGYRGRKTPGPEGDPARAKLSWPSSHRASSSPAPGQHQNWLPCQHPDPHCRVWGSCWLLSHSRHFTSTSTLTPQPLEVRRPGPAQPPASEQLRTGDGGRGTLKEIGQDKQVDFCWDPWQRCFQTTNGYLSNSRSRPGNYNVAALATSSLVGVVQSIKDHITKPTAMARGRVAHLIEWKGWSAQRAGWELSPAEDEHYCCLPDELREARFAAGVAEQFAITEATLSAWSSLDDEELHPENSPQGIVQLQDLESIYLQDSLPSGPSQDDSLRAFSSPGPSPDSCPSPEEPPSTTGIPQPPSPELQHPWQLPGAQGPEGGTHLPGSLPSMDSGSL
ncbi:protein FAM131C-like [Symphalangus syndactylus]|uniref:protein FAM131C-like n=1 Tax=Symphalangus syndactylus TaxID=9590 RepID=UPI002442C3EC|nr:protein FAM131C-like [Symphalangus syndactylus]